jgi:MFS family permease
MTETAHDPYAALRLRDYRCLLSGGVLASIGVEIQATAVFWELAARAGSQDEAAVAVGLAGLAQFLPVLLLALPAGQAADHFHRRRLFQGAQGVVILASLGLAAVSWWQLPVALTFLVLLLAGVGRAFTAPSRSALLALVVPPHLLPNAVTWNSTGYQMANVTGPALGGLLLWLAEGKAAPVYLLTAGCALACIILVAPIKLKVAPPGEARSLASLLAGARFVWRTKLLLAAITLDLFAVLLGGFTALLPIFTQKILQVDERGYGLLRTAPALGALGMALVLAHRPPLRRAGRALLLAVAGFGVATIVFGLSRNYYLSFAMMVLTGALDNISVVVRGTLMQVLTPNEMRGRVGAVNFIFISSSNELGAFESGMTAAWFGPVGSVVFGGVGTLLVVGLVALRWPQLLRLGALHTLQPPAAPPAPRGPTTEAQELVASFGSQSTSDAIALPGETERVVAEENQAPDAITPPAP